MTNPLLLGPYELLQHIGEGGMGTIWRGVHRQRGLPVAVKLLRREKLDSHIGELEREVRAHAGLNHPGIVVLFDFANVTANEAEASDGKLVAGSPYIAMELADAGSVRARMPLSSWVEVRNITVSALGALAHAHSRGVVHRDIKPENILLFGDAPHVVKLADFGIAHATYLEHEADSKELSSFSGTAHYAAPEQILGRWRLFGPWTDVYAVGCVVWELVCGTAPFEGHWMDVVRHHLESDFPRFEPQMAVPDGLRDWLAYATARNPMERFSTCSDALQALPEGELPGVLDETLPLIRALDLDLSPADGESFAPTLVDVDTNVLTDVAATMVDASLTETTVLMSEHASSRRSKLRRAPVTVRLPDDWRTDALADNYRYLDGTGLGLFGLREPRFIGREHERNILWEQLRRVVDGEARAVFIVGGPGIGKSSLARWVATQAQELGAARSLKAFNAPEAPGQADGFPGLLRRAFRAWNLTGDELYEHIAPQLAYPAATDFDERDSRLVTGWLGAADSDAFPFPNVEQRNHIAHRLLLGFSRIRPTVAWLDDLQWSSELAQTLEHILNAERQPNVLYVVTLRSDVLADSPQIAERLAPLLKHSAAIRIDLGPLSPSDEASLVRELLPVDERLAERIAERAEGNPLFARQLLRWLVDSSPKADGGFVWPDRIEGALPGTIQELFDQRIDRLLASLGDDSGRAEQAIEVAASLGRQFDKDEWEAAVERLTGGFPDGLPEALVLRGLARQVPPGFEFEHALLVDSLLERAAAHGRLKQHHEVCALALKGSESLETQLREMEHWVKAQHWERAVEVSSSVANPLARRGNMIGLARLLERRLEWLGFVDTPDAELRRLGTLLQLGILRTDAPVEGAMSAREIAGLVLERARADSHLELEMKALELLAMVAERDGSFSDSRRYALAALEAARRFGTPRVECVASVRLGWAYLYEGGVANARAAFEAAQKLADDMEDPYLGCYVAVGRIWLAFIDEDHDESRRLNDELLVTARLHKWPILVSYGFAQQAVRAIINGSFEAALTAIRHALEASARAETKADAALLGSLEGISLLLVGRFDDAAAGLEAVKRTFEATGLANEAAYVRVLELGVAAARNDERAFDAAVEWFLGAEAINGIVRPEHPFVADWAAEQWAACSVRASSAREVSARMRVRLGMLIAE